MKIKSITVGGFKNLKKTRASLDGITAIISINNYGKSNLLEAIDFGCDFIFQNPRERKTMMRWSRAIPINKKLADNEIDGAPVIKNGKVVGVFTLTDLVQAVADGNEGKTVGELMSTNVVIVNEDLKIANAIEVILKKSISRLIIADNDNNLLGIVTRTDLIDSITNLKQFPIITN